MHEMNMASLLEKHPDVRDLSLLEGKVDWWMISSALLTQKEQTEQQPGPADFFHTQSPQSNDGVIRWAKRQISTRLLLPKFLLQAF